MEVATLPTPAPAGVYLPMYFPQDGSFLISFPYVFIFILIFIAILVGPVLFFASFASLASPSAAHIIGCALLLRFSVVPTPVVVALAASLVI